MRPKLIRQGGFTPAESFGRVGHPSTPPKQRPLNFRVPHSRRRRGCGFRRNLTTAVPRNSYFGSRSKVHTLFSPHRRRNSLPISVTPQSRTLACQPQAVESAAPGTAKAITDPKTNQLLGQLPQWYHPPSPCVNRNRTN